MAQGDEEHRVYIGAIDEVTFEEFHDGCSQFGEIFKIFHDPHRGFGLVPYYHKEDFELESTPLGTGRFASVYRARYLKPGQEKDVAIKKISNSFVKQKGIQDRLKKELDIHLKLDHENIVKCYTTFKDDNFTYLVLELCQLTLEEYLKKERPMVEICAFEIIKQIVAGLHYLHSKKIMHGDLSLRNILVTAKRKIKIADFGLSTLFENPRAQLNSIVGTPKFQSPEVRDHKTYDLNSDCWSLGIVILAVLGGDLPWIIVGDIEIPSKFSTQAQELVKGLLQKNPCVRWTLKDVMDSVFFKKYKTFLPQPTISSDFGKYRTNAPAPSASNVPTAQSDLFNLLSPRATLCTGFAVASVPEPKGATKAKETKVETKTEDKKVDLQCKICMDEQVGIVFLPCGHLASCPKCAQRISNCPMCRKRITGKVRTYLS